MSTVPSAPPRRGLPTLLIAVAIVVGGVLWFRGRGAPTGPPPRLRVANPVVGDVNADGKIDKDDVEYLAEHLMAKGPVPLGSGDVDGNGKIDILDVFYLRNYLFAHGPAPVMRTPASGHVVTPTA